MTKNLPVENKVDDQGAGQSDAVEVLRLVRDEAFAGNNASLATALGRSEEQVEGWFNGTETIDDDVIMKARGIAQERNVELDKA